MSHIQTRWIWCNCFPRLQDPPDPKSHSITFCKASFVLLFTHKVTYCNFLLNIRTESATLALFIAIHCYNSWLLFLGPDTSFRWGFLWLDWLESACWMQTVWRQPESVSWLLHLNSTESLSHWETSPSTPEPGQQQRRRPAGRRNEPWREAHCSGGGSEERAAALELFIDPIY